MAFYIRLALFCEISQGIEVFSWQKKWCKFLFIWIQTKTSTDTSRDKQNNVSRICVVKTAKQRLEFAPRSCYLIQRYSFDIVAVWISSNSDDYHVPKKAELEEQMWRCLRTRSAVCTTRLNMYFVEGSDEREVLIGRTVIFF